MRDVNRRVRDVAVCLVKTGDTVRSIALQFGVSKSTIHLDLNERLKVMDRDLYQQVKRILVLHNEEKCFRGGQATKSKYERIRQDREGV